MGQKEARPPSDRLQFELRGLFCGLGEPGQQKKVP